MNLKLWRVSPKSKHAKPRSQHGGVYHYYFTNHNATYRVICRVVQSCLVYVYSLVSICVCISVAIWIKFLYGFAYFVLATTHTGDWPGCKILRAKAWTSCEDHQTKWDCRKICNLQICCLSILMIMQLKMWHINTAWSYFF